MVDEGEIILKVKEKKPLSVVGAVDNSIRVGLARLVAGGKVGVEEGFTIAQEVQDSWRRGVVRVKDSSPFETPVKVDGELVFGSYGATDISLFEAGVGNTGQIAAVEAIVCEFGGQNPYRADGWKFDDGTHQYLKTIVASEGREIRLALETAEGLNEGDVFERMTKDELRKPQSQTPFRSVSVSLPITESLFHQIQAANWTDVQGIAPLSTLPGRAEFDSAVQLAREAQ